MLVKLLASCLRHNLFFFQQFTAGVKIRIYIVFCLLIVAFFELAFKAEYIGCARFDSYSGHDKTQKKDDNILLLFLHRLLVDE